MARIIFISPYLKGGKDASKLANRTRYVATREGVELLDDQEDDLVVDTRENFLDYISHRPGVQKEGDHGLWDAAGKVRDLSKVVREVSQHPGRVWTPVVALRREDADRLGYNNAANWRALVNSILGEIAKGYQIHPNHLRWYGAFHEKENQVHIHMVIYSSDPKEGYLSKEGIRTVKAAFARNIYRQDLMHVYEQKDRYRSQVQDTMAKRMAELLTELAQGGGANEKLERLTWELAMALQTTKGKKVYGYLPSKVKAKVDAIVEELASDRRVSEAYDLWSKMREETFQIYSENLPPRLPLSQQKEFKSVRNMVIREAMKLAEIDTSAIATDVECQPKLADVSPAVSKPPVRKEPDVQLVNTAQPAHIPAANLSSCVIRLFYNMSRIFEENCKTDNIYRGIQNDKKRRRQLRERKRSLGQRLDDHEEY